MGRLKEIDVECRTMIAVGNEAGAKSYLAHLGFPAEEIENYIARVYAERYRDYIRQRRFAARRASLPGGESDTEIDQAPAEDR